MGTGREAMSRCADGLWARVVLVLATLVGCFSSASAQGRPDFLWLAGGHSYEVRSVAYSPDGQFLASGSQDGTTKLWNNHAGALIRTHSYPSAVYSVSFSPDGQTLAVGGNARTILYYEVSTGSLIRTIEANTNGIMSIAFSPDGQTLAAGLYDRTIKLWNAQTGALIRTLTGHSNALLSVAFSPDGQTLASGSSDTTVRLWNVQTGALIRTLTGHTKNVESVAFSPDGQTLASGSWDRTIKLWNAQTGALRNTLSAHTSNVESISFSPDGQTLASGSGDATIKLWNAQTGALKSNLTGHASTVLSVAFSPVDQTLASGSSDRTIKLWNAQTGVHLNSLTTNYFHNSLAMSPIGETLATASLYDIKISLVNAGTGALDKTIPNPAGSNSNYEFSPDGQTLAAGSWDKTIKLWNVQTGALIRTLTGHTNPVYSVAFSPDGQTLASGDDLAKTIKVWNAQTGALLHSLIGHSDRIVSLAFSPDAQTLASGSWDKSVKLWNVQTGALIRTLVGHQYKVDSVKFSPDGLGLVSGGGDEFFKVGELRLWNVLTGSPIRTLAGHSSRVRSVAFSPDGQTLASASSDGTVRFWDPTTGNQLLKYDQETAPASVSIAYSPDGTTLALGRDDATLGVFINPFAPDPNAFRLKGVSPFVLARRPSITLTAFGSGFVAGATLRLEQSGQTPILPTSQVKVQSPFFLTATFDLTLAQPGSWDVIVRLPDGREGRKANALTIEAGSGAANWIGYITSPARMRTSRLGTVTFSITNNGTGEGAAPLIAVEAFDADSGERLGIPMRAGPSDSWSPGGLLFVGSGSTKASQLGLGESFGLSIQFRSPNQNTKIKWKLSEVPKLKSEVFASNWELLKQAAKPIGTSQEGWNHLWNTFTSQIGPDDKSLFNYMRSAGEQTANIGNSAFSVDQLLQVPLANASGEMSPVGVLESATDVSFPAPELPLTFGRVASPVGDRDTILGPMGRTWAHTYQISADIEPIYVTDSNGTAKLAQTNVAIVYPDRRTRLFTAPVGAPFVATPGDPGKLVDLNNNGGKYDLVEPDGTVARFGFNDRIARITTPNGVSLNFEYLGGGEKLAKITHSAGASFTLAYSGNQIKSVSGPGGKGVTYNYDGVKLSEAILDDGRKTTYQYITEANTPTDNALTRVTYPDGRTRSFSYDVTGRLTSIAANNGSLPVSFTYGPLGQITVDHPSGTSEVNRAWHGLAGRTVDTLGSVSGSEYDSFLNPAKQSFAGRTTSTIGDENNNILQATDPKGATRGASYTKDLNRLDWFRDARGKTLEFDYDLKGNVRSITHPDGTKESYTHEPWGGVKTHTNRRGQTTTYGYNENGQVTSVVNASESLSYTYDERGNQRTASSSKTGTITMSYDRRDFMTRIEYPGGKWFSYSYDDAGRRTLRLGQDTPALAYQYDEIGRLDKVLADGAQLVDYDYDPQGRLSSEARGNGTRTTYGYDAGSRPTFIKHYGPGNVLQAQYQYGGYDDFGNPHSLNTPLGTWNYGYDAVNQLTSVTPPGGPTSVATYDAEGNRVNEATGNSSVGYTTNGLNQYLSVGAESFTYDADGNMKTRTVSGQTTTYDWNASGQLVKVTMPNADVFEYEYDALGNRSKAWKNGVATTFVYDGDNMAAEYAADGTLGARYLHGSGLVARQDASTIGYYGFDATGHTRLVTSANGSVANSYEVKPFGGFVSKTESIPNRFRYVGKYGVAEDETGLFHMRARYYDPGLGRFISEDPTGLGGEDASLYRYGYNNPITRADPSGKLAPLVIYLGAVAFSGVVGVVTDYGISTARGGEGYTVQQAATTFAFDAGLAVIPMAGAMKHLTRFRKAANLVNWERQLVQHGPANPYLMGYFESALSKSKLTRQTVDDVFAQGPGRGFWAFHEPFFKTGKIGIMAEILKFLMDAPPVLGESPTEVRTSWDPNDKVGPVGVGVERYIRPDGALDYTINFENKKEAGAHAQEVVIADVLDSDLDISTMELGEVQVGSQTVGDMIGFQTGSIRVPLKDSNLLMDVIVDFNLTARTITWRVKAVDPLTGDFPAGVDEGILPPNDDNGSGEGHVRFRIKPRATIAHGAKIDNKASIVFDQNPVIVTNTWTNTIDKQGPSSKVDPLPATSPYRFSVSWSGTDVGAGVIEDYDVYSSENGAAYRLWLSGTKATSAVYETIPGRTVRFYSVARDGAGNVEAPPSTPDATTQTVARPLPQIGTVHLSQTNGALTFSISGEGFTADCVVRWNGVTVSSQFVSGQKMVANVNGGATTGTLVIARPGPDGGPSNEVPVTLISARTATVVLDDFGGSAAGKVAQVQLLAAGTETVVWSKDVPLSAAGLLAFDSSAPLGTYDVRVRVDQWLSRRSDSVNLAGTTLGLTFSLLNGDIDKDNAVTVFDYAILSDYFDKTDSDSDWNTVGANGLSPKDADLDGDGGVTVFDYSILSDNFDKVGE